VMALVVIARQLSVASVFIVMECDYQTKWFTFVDEGRAISCNVNNLKVTSPLEVIGKLAESYKGTEEVKGLLIRHQKILFFPSGIVEVLPYLEGIYLEGTHLQKIGKEDLQPFPELKELRIIKNYLIITIDGDTFNYNQQLQCLDLSGNNLRHVDCNILDSLVLLKQAYFNFNLPYINEQATTKTEMMAMNIKFMETCPNYATALKDSCILIVIIIVKLVLFALFLYYFY